MKVRAEAGVEGFDDASVSWPLKTSDSGRVASGGTVGESVVKGRWTAEDDRNVPGDMRGNG
jgi:hypothetical protein